MDNTQTAKIIKNLCKNRKIPIKKFLEESGIRAGLIHDMEGKDKTPSAKLLEKIADYFDCSVDYLIGRTDNPAINR
jgi:transcriptional regulator with XRE-family HTH domain